MQGGFLLCFTRTAATALVAGAAVSTDCGFFYGLAAGRAFYCHTRKLKIIDVNSILLKPQSFNRVFARGLASREIAEDKTDASGKTNCDYN